MTNEEAIEVLEQDLSCEFDKDLIEALEMAIEALEERERVLSWLSKFCRHIDMGDEPYTDAEVYEFFKNKMNQQFGWE